MTSYVTSIPIPPVSKEFITALSNAFTPYEIKPGFDRDELMQSVGEQKVIEWITHHAMRGRSVLGEPDALRTTTPTGAVVKIGE